MKQWGCDKSVEEFMYYWFKSEHNTDEELVGSIGELRRKGVWCCLATNQEKYRFRYMLGEMEFSKCFDQVYASAHLGDKKPARDFFVKIFNDLKVQKYEVLFWDDSQANIDAAKEFGINAELYTDFQDYKEKMISIYKLLG